MAETLYAGLANVSLGVDQVELGDGVIMRRVYAHLMSPCLMAFAPPSGEGKPHAGPWRAAQGGFGHDIQIEIEVPDGHYPAGLSQQDVVWWLAALLRLSHFPYLGVPVLSDRSLTEAARCEPPPTLRPFETQYRLFQPGEDAEPELAGEHLDWLVETWREAATTLLSNEKFNLSMRAFDACTVQGRHSATLLALWGGLEHLFSPAASELRYRISSNIAAYLEPFGPKRLALHKKIMALYNVRSTAAHTASHVEVDALVESYVTMRNALMKMVNDRRIPTQEDFEKLIFSGDATITSGFGDATSIETDE